MSVSAPLGVRPSRTGRDPSTPWIIAGSSLLLLLPLWHLFPGESHAAEVGQGIATLVRTSLAGTALLWAAGRVGLHPRLRESLAIIGGTSMVSALMAVAYVLTETTRLPEAPAGFFPAWSFLSFALLLVAILRMPLTSPLSGREGWTFTLDALVSVGGWIAVTWTLMVEPWDTSPLHPGGSLMPAAYVAMSTLVLAALNFLTLRGRAMPSERAFVLFLVGQSSHLLSLFLRALNSPGWSHAPWADVAYYTGAVPLLWSAWAMRRDALQEPGTEIPVHWIREFNPFALALPLLTSAALLRVWRTGPASSVWPLAFTAGAVSILLALRLSITIVERHHRLRAEADRDARQQSERLEALRRVAGGVAHAFNNSLTVILGRTDPDLLSNPRPETLEALACIRVAAQRSADLTRHLLWFTGRQHHHREVLETCTWLRTLEPEVRAMAGDAIVLNYSVPFVPGTVTGDPLQLRTALFELVRNGIEAMPGGGRLEVTLDSVAREPGPKGTPASPMHRISVSDTGRGIAPEHVSQLFEPFFSTAAIPMPDSGMGLAIAYGVAQAHKGLLEVESRPGGGSTFRVLLPANPEG